MIDKVKLGGLNIKCGIIIRLILQGFFNSLKEEKLVYS